MKILVVYNHDSTWVHDDVKILQKHFDVDLFYYKKDKKKKNLKKLVESCDVVYIWFASYHGLKATFLAKRYGKKVVVVASGYSVADVPEFNYGLASKFYTRWIPSYILGRSDLVLAVSQSNKKEIQVLKPDKENLVVVPHGFETEKYKPAENLDKQKMVITVGGLDKTSFKRKGVDNFLSVAQYFPDVPFVVVGRIKDDVRDEIKDVSSNVEFTGFVSDEKLLEWYQKAKVYAQFSFHEAFGCSVAEAMLCGCIPVVSDKGSLPEVIGDVGFSVSFWDEEKAVECVKKALSEDGDMKREVRSWIVEQFSMEKREQ
ncbi:MAG: glycosyltransferase family 4 protein, partial [Candidatus Thermoplasmatota archaeon]